MILVRWETVFLREELLRCTSVHFWTFRRAFFANELRSDLRMLHEVVRDYYLDELESSSTLEWPCAYHDLNSIEHPARTNQPLKLLELEEALCIVNVFCNNHLQKYVPSEVWPAGCKPRLGLKPVIRITNHKKFTKDFFKNFNSLVKYITNFLNF